MRPECDLASLTYSVTTVDKSVSRAIIDGRQRKNLTQKDLATVRLLHSFKA